jgi:hypothetical protein
MARNINVNWVYPTVRESGKPLLPSEIQSMELSLSVDNTNWAIFNTYPASQTSTLVTEMDAGEWFFRGIVIDTNNRRSAPLVASVVVPDETNPGALTSLTATLA